MSSAKRRLEQVNSQIQNDQSQDKTGLKCTVKEHSPGHKVATITFNNAAKLNVVNRQILDAFIQTCQKLSKDDALRAVVITGAPPVSAGKPASFIGGADIQELSQLSSSKEAREYISRVSNACSAIRDLPVPVIARVHGFSLGAGLELMAVCDLKIATKDSKFGMPEVKIGVPSVVEAALFPALIGLGRTKRLIYLAENVSAKTAEEWGLIERAVDDEVQLDKAVDEWVGMIVKMGPKSMKIQKKLIRKWEDESLESAIQAGVGALEETYADSGKEAKEYMKPFLGKQGGKR